MTWPGRTLQSSLESKHNLKHQLQVGRRSKIYQWQSTHAAAGISWPLDPITRFPGTVHTVTALRSGQPLDPTHLHEQELSKDRSSYFALLLFSSCGCCG